MFLLEKTVCENYGCSKATAGEVLHQLCECGILESYPRKGYILHIPQSREFLQIQRMRMAIEGMEIHWIIRNCSDEAIKAKFCAPFKRAFKGARISWFLIINAVVNGLANQLAKGCTQNNPCCYQ